VPAGRTPDFPLRVALAIVALALASGFVLRTLDLKADPPPDLSWSSAIYSDEAHNAYSARNWALYGQWQVDDYAPYLVYPWLNLFTGLVFRIAGIGFEQLKFVSLLAGLLLVVTAASFQLVMYSRLGLAEMTQALFVAATVAFLVRANTSRAAAVLSGACALFAILFVKVSAAFLLPAVLLLVIYEMIRARLEHVRLSTISSQALLWLLGASVPLVVWFAVVFIPHHDAYLAYVFGHSIGAKAGRPNGVTAYLVNALSIGSQSKLYDKLPMVAALGFVSLPALVRRAGRTAVLSSFVLVTGVAMLGAGYYHPDRYELFSLIPLIAGFAFAVDRLIEKEVRIGHPWPHLPGVLLYGLWLWPLAAQIAFRLTAHRDGTDGATIAALAAGQVASFGLWGLHRLTRGGVPLRGRLLRFAVAAAFVLLALGRDAKLYAGWYGTRTRLMYDYSRELDQTLPDNSVTGGFWAPAMLSTSHKRAVFISDQWGANLTDPVERFGLTHLVVTSDEEFVLLDSITNGRVSRAQVVRLFQINEFVMVAVLQLGPPSPSNR
jgi:hypothetical protein